MVFNVTLNNISVMLWRDDVFALTNGNIFMYFLLDNNRDYISYYIKYCIQKETKTDNSNNSRRILFSSSTKY